MTVIDLEQCVLKVRGLRDLLRDIARQNFAGNCVAAAGKKVRERIPDRRAIPARGDRSVLGRTLGIVRKHARILVSK